MGKSNGRKFEKAVSSKASRSLAIVLSRERRSSEKNRSIVGKVRQETEISWEEAEALGRSSQERLQEPEGTTGKRSLQTN
jgi:hypothetical protein